MNTIWFVIGGVLVYFVAVRHGGNLASAWEEVAEIIQDRWVRYIRPRASKVIVWARENKGVATVVLAVVVFLVIKFVVPMSQPTQVGLTWGSNNIVDGCDRSFVVYILMQYEKPEERQEFIPEDHNTTFSIRSPLSEVGCAIEFTPKFPQEVLGEKTK